jgi:transcriptional regulator with XRE-family HTH domain
MKSDRRIISSSLSVDIVEYLRRKKLTQVQIAKMLGVSEGFISLVKSRERSLTLDHLERIVQTLDVPLGAFLLGVMKPPKGAKARKLYEMTAEIMRQGDIMHQAIQHRVVHTR